MGTATWPSWDLGIYATDIQGIVDDPQSRASSLGVRDRQRWGIQVAKQLYWYRIAAGDPDHLPESYFASGVIEAEPQEIEAIRADLDDHSYDIDIWPVADVVIGLDKFRAELGRGLRLMHEAVLETQPCEADRPYIAAHEAEFAKEESGHGFVPFELPT